MPIGSESTQNKLRGVAHFLSFGSTAKCLPLRRQFAGIYLQQRWPQRRSPQSTGTLCACQLVTSSVQRGLQPAFQTFLLVSLTKTKKKGGGQKQQSGAHLF